MICPRITCSRTNDGGVTVLRLGARRLTMFFQPSRNRLRAVAAGFALVTIAPGLIQAQAQEIWTLEASIRRVLEVAPENRSAQSEVAAREGAWRQAGAWPNPEIALRADDKMGKDDGRGGRDLTQFAFSQPLPLSNRRRYQRDIAGTQFSGAQSQHRYQILLLETETARRFHTLQLTAASLGLAELRQDLADELQQAGRRRQQAGELAELERLRLDLIRESAQQLLDKAEGEFGEASSLFRAYLGLPENVVPEPAPLEPFGALPDLQILQSELRQHPAILSANALVEAARTNVDLARSERWPDPVLSLFRERDVLDGRRQEVTGVGVGVTVPLWDHGRGRIDEARAQAAQARSGVETLERDLNSRLQQSHQHLSHLVAQGEHYRTRVFEPARRVFDLTRKAYAAGEVEILSLIDANNMYFDTHTRYFELLQEAWLEAAEVRLAAGHLLVSTVQERQP